MNSIELFDRLITNLNHAREALGQATNLNKKIDPYKDIPKFVGVAFIISGRMTISSDLFQLSALLSIRPSLNHYLEQDTIEFYLDHLPKSKSEVTQAFDYYLNDEAVFIGTKETASDLITGVLNDIDEDAEHIYGSWLSIKTDLDKEK